MAKIRYAQVGIGGRAQFFYSAIVSTYKETSELVGFCDTNQTRMNYANKVIVESYGHHELATYKAEDFDKMIAETKPDVVIVTSIDRTHHKYIIRAMQLGCDVISEKPMTVDEVKAQEIVDTIKKTGKNLRVTFNYRYAPYNSKICELIMNDTIGQVTSIHFEWLLNTQHGADYFRRWHRDKRNSGGLLVHKSTHHFDLVNFWIGAKPQTVYAMGDLMFYGKENAENRGITKFYSRTYGSEIAKSDHFALDLQESENLKSLYLDAEHEDGYYRDKSVFDDGINIEDTMGVIVKYDNKAILTYSLNAYMPWEGYRVALNGTKGRIEYDACETIYVNGQGDSELEGAHKYSKIRVCPLFEAPYEAEVDVQEGGHGGGDPVLLNDIFGTPNPDPLNRAADYKDGAMSILTGIAANKSIATGKAISVNELLKI